MSIGPLLSAPAGSRRCRKGGNRRIGDTTVKNCRQGHRLLIAMLAVTMVAVALPATAGSPKGVCQAGGVNSRVLGDAQRQYWEWVFGASDQQQVGRLFFMPIPVGVPVGDPVIFTGSEAFAVRPGTTLVLPMLVFYGESYTTDSGIPDDDVNFPGKEFFTDSSVLLTVDGRAIVDSERSKLDCAYFDAVFFTDPIVYDEPTDYGSDAALWVKGLGILLPPLHPGTHVIRLQELTPADPFGVFGYDNTWDVTVETP